MIAAAVLTALLIQLSLPWLQRYALARPNARSSHRVPTPQGGGAAVVLGGGLVVALALTLEAAAGPTPAVAALAVGTAVLAGLGAWDDLRPLAPAPRLVVQLVVAALLAATLPASTAPVSVPPVVLWATATVGTVWFVNLVNFMDGLDWLTVAELVPVTLALTVLGVAGVLAPEATLVAAALAGGLLGFAPFNRPVARLFLGDVGSLPIGLVVAWLLLQLAAAGHHAAALLLPAYYLADATWTLARRIARGERFWEPHRSHFYQRATEHGFDALAVALRVARLNLGLAILAFATVLHPSLLVDLAALGVGAVLVLGQLRAFTRQRPVRP